MTDMIVKENVSLQQYNTLAISVSSRWFIRVDTIEQLQQALVFLKQKQCPLLILGGGSNVVLTADFDGLCLHIALQGRDVEQDQNDFVLLSLAAGENWHEAVMYCVSQQWHGIENLALIPGSVGAAPIQNIGAYGVEIEQCFEYLEALDIATGRMVKLNHDDCQFAYRDSVFKHQLKDQLVITRVVLKLSKQQQWTLNYPVLQKAIEQVLDARQANVTEIDAKVIADTVIKIRKSKLPDPIKIPNAGSFFKNPIVSESCYQRLIQQYPDLVAYPQANKTYKLAAGWLLDNVGWKGRVIDEIAMHHDQALVLTNPSGASGERILRFVQQVKASMQEHYQLAFEVEPRIY